MNKYYEVCYKVPGTPCNFEVRRRVIAEGLTQAKNKAAENIAAEYCVNVDSLKFQHITRVN